MELNEIKYCVNHKGQKIKPYKSVCCGYEKKTDWDSIVSYGIVIALCTFFSVAVIIMIAQ